MLLDPCDHDTVERATAAVDRGVHNAEGLTASGTLRPHPADRMKQPSDL
jgi:hypothetical protein